MTSFPFLVASSPHLLLLLLLLLLLFLAPLPSHSQSHSQSQSQSQSTLTFDRCFPQTTCTAPRRCISFTDFVCKPTSPFCFCLPLTALPPCSTRRHCPNPAEQCTQDRDLTTFCASRNAVRVTSFLAPAPSPPSFPSSGLALDDCAPDSAPNAACADDLICRFPRADASLAACDSDSNPRRRSCVCFPRKRAFKPCFVSAACSPREVCAQTPFVKLPACVAKRAAQRWIALRRVAYQPPPGNKRRFSLEPCGRNADCDHPRVCRYFGNFASGSSSKKLAPCKGRDFCACYPEDQQRNRCDATAQCGSRNEVCAKTFFFQGRAVCVSIRARREYDHIEQVQSNDVCPVLFKPQPPLMSRMSHAAAAPAVSRIQGGLRVSDGLRKYLAYVDVRNRSTCSAVLVAPKWIMSAAHCDLRKGSLVVIGARARNPTPMAPFLLKTEIARVVVHPEYNPKLQNDLYDVVLARLKDEAPKTARTIPIIKDEGVPRPQQPVRAVGYGDTSATSQAKSTALRQVDLRVLDIQQCNMLAQRFLPFPRDYNRKLQICVRSDRERCGPCFGDSGGPLIVYSRDGQPLLAGIASTGVGCDTARFPAVYTKVGGAVSEWVRKEVPEVKC